MGTARGLVAGLLVSCALGSAEARAQGLDDGGRDPAVVFPSPPSSALAPPSVDDRGPVWAPPIVHGLALLTVMRVGEAILFPEPFAETRLSVLADRYDAAFTQPPLFDPHKPFMRWDGDSLFINVVGHGGLGSELYLRARSCHFGVLGSTVFAAAGSAAWEFLFEASGVRPSGQDLVYTPLAGLVLGEARYAIAGWGRHLDTSWARSVVPAVVDPFGELERQSGWTRC